MKIAIVGGGIAGLVSGFLAAEAGHEVEVFEREQLGAGASGKALGVLVPITGLDRPVDVLQRAGIAAWPELARRLAAVSGVDVGDFWRDWGGGRQQVRLPLLFEVLRLGIEGLGGFVRDGVEVLAGDVGLLHQEVGPRTLGGAPKWDPSPISTHLSSGVTPPPTAEAFQKQAFDRVVLAGGLGNIVLAGAEMKVSAGVACRLGVTGLPDYRVTGLVVGDNLFVCPDWDGTVLVGSVNWEMREAGDGVVPAEKLEELVRRVGALVPGLAGAEVVESWVGYRPVEVPRLPLLRDLGSGILAVVGLGKVGIGLAPELRVWE